MGKARTRDGGETNERGLGQGNSAVAFESKLDARVCGAELSAKSSGSEVGGKICGAELGAMYSSAKVLATSTPPKMPYYGWPDTLEPRSVAPRCVTSAP